MQQVTGPDGGQGDLQEESRLYQIFDRIAPSEGHSSTRYLKCHHVCCNPEAYR